MTFRIWIGMILIGVALSAGGCDRIYGLLHKPGGEEREILGAFTFNEYSPKVEELQKVLKLFGYNIGRPDGKFGAGTREALARFQKDEGLKATRFLDKQTWQRMQALLAMPLIRDGQVSGKAVQQALRKAGYDPGKIDGQIGKQSRDAIKSFQRGKGLDADGHVGLKTMKALSVYLAPVVATATVNE